VDHSKIILAVESGIFGTIPGWIGAVLGVVRLAGAPRRNPRRNAWSPRWKRQL